MDASWSLSAQRPLLQQLTTPPWLFIPEINSTSARVLLFLVVPGHLIFFYIIYLVEGQSVPNDRSFVVLYLLAGLVQVRLHPVGVQPAEPSWERGSWTRRHSPWPSRRGVNLSKPKNMTQKHCTFLSSGSELWVRSAALP